MNRLSKETSPYLLQHAQNPVHWYPWGSEAFEYAKANNKLVIVSIGYSACHWCHVMEHEVFEDFECAELMNLHFVSIKVDREERPDVDHLYMDAIHLMGQRGGWPLNVFVLPDGRPIYGGTYFPKKTWISVLENIVDLHQKQPSKVFEYAEKIARGIGESNLLENDPVEHFDIETLNEVVDHWSKYWDLEKGGMKKAPKFPMPNHYLFLLEFGKLSRREDLLNFVELSISQMAMGGIYDQIGGGFARYSVDDQWKVPHFEKMLYDNAQLIQVYSQAYKNNSDPHFKRIAMETISFLRRELRSKEGLYYSALDADSEGVEGKFYIWTEAELKEVLSDDFDFASKYYNINENGFWEHGQYILLRNLGDEAFSLEYGMSMDQIVQKRQLVNNKLMSIRDKRIRPGLDHKILLSWNALTITGFAESASAFNDDELMNEALKVAEALWQWMYVDGRLQRVRTNEKSSGLAFADDYAFTIEAFYNLGLLSGEMIWMQRAHDLMELALGKFFDPQQEMFWFSDKRDETLVFTRKLEISDNVLPAANSVLCRMLKLLGTSFETPEWEELSLRMLGKVLVQIDFASAYTNWLRAYVWEVFGLNQVVVAGADVEESFQNLRSMHLPNTLVLASTKHSGLPLVKGKQGTQPTFYVCKGKTCFAPVTEIKEALALLE